MQDGRKAVWSIPYVSVTFFSSLKQNFIAEAETLPQVYRFVSHISNG